MKIFIVDDEADTLKLLKVILEGSGFDVFTTLNSIEALNIAPSFQPDVILLDVMMPKIDGFKLCTMLRDYTNLRDIPVILVTAYSALDLEDRRRECGANLVLPKPVSIPALLEAIEYAVAEQQWREGEN